VIKKDEEEILMSIDLEVKQNSKINKKSLYGLLFTLAIGIIICILPTPKGLTPEGQRALALLVMAAILWLSDIVPLGATSLLIIALAPLMGTLDAKKSMQSLGNDVIFLFLGGFIVAIAMSKFGLDKRIALWIIKKVGTSTKKVMLGIMLAVGFLSMWMSNTVAVLCILPIVLGIIKVLGLKPGQPQAKMYLFGLAFSSLIGGMSTIIGTPPNALAVSFLKEMCNIDITFGRWFIIGFPIALFLLIATWWLLANIVYKCSSQEDPTLKKYIDSEYEKLSGMDTTEIITAFTLIIFVVLLLTIPYVRKYIGSQFWVQGTVAVLPTAILYFTGLLDWKDTKEGVAWHILLLFAAGISLSGAISGTGAAEWLAQIVANNVPLALVPITFTLLGGIMTQMTSNTGTAAIFAPIAISAALLLKVDPVSMAVPLALGTSMGFMTPIGSALNPLIYGQLTDGNTYIDKGSDYFAAGRLPWLVGMGFTIIYVIYVLPLFGL
jgi:sodium-dependent dicarboxylate transporter 2/3/5